jgi:murein DD-endopeptidase MepM/ murein hydrolase activator NlpD
LTNIAHVKHRHDNGVKKFNQLTPNADKSPNEGPIDDGRLAVRMRLAASSAVAIVLMTASIIGVRSIHTGHSSDKDAQAPAIAAPAKTAFDYDSLLASTYTANDSDLPGAANTALPPQTRLTLIVGDGETLAGVLATGDVSTNDIQAAVDAARDVYDPRKLRAGQVITLSYKPGAEGSAFQGFEIQADAEHMVTVARGADGFSAQQTKLAVRAEVKAAHGVIRNSLIESAAAAGVPYNVTAALIRAFSYDVDFQRDIQPGDRFKVMFDNLVSDSGSRPGDVQFAELILSGKSHAIYGVRREDGAVEFFTRDGKSIKKGLLKTPVDGARLTSGFGMRLHPILGYTRMHKGVDFGVPTGTPIYAAGDGVVEFSGWAGGYGRFVKIKHNPHMETAYGHMSRIALTTAVGHHVSQGQVIGYVGMTGDATGPHLHYEVLKDGSQVNPINVTMPVNSGLEGGALVAFLKTAEEREQRFAAIVDGPQVASAHSN